MNLFDRKKGFFIRYDFLIDDPDDHQSTLSAKHLYGVNAITGDEVPDNLLIGTDKDGLWKFDIKRKSFTQYKINLSSGSDAKTGWIQSFYKSQNGKLWIISDNSVTSLELPSGKFKTLYRISPNG